jgi:hypothetical protein
MTPNALVLTVARDSLMLSQGLLSKYFGKSHVISRVRLCEVGASTCELLPEFLRQFVSQLRRLSQGGNQNQATLQSGRYICVKRENKYQTEFESLAKALTSASSSHICRAANLRTSCEGVALELAER